MALFTHPEGSLGLRSIKRISYGAFEVFGFNLSLDEIVGGTRLHRLDVHITIAVASQHDHRRIELVPCRFAE